MPFRIDLLGNRVGTKKDFDVPEQQLLPSMPALLVCVDRGRIFFPRLYREVFDPLLMEMLRRNQDVLVGDDPDLTRDVVLDFLMSRPPRTFFDLLLSVSFGDTAVTPINVVHFLCTGSVPVVPSSCLVDCGHPLPHTGPLMFSFSKCVFAVLFQLHLAASSDSPPSFFSIPCHRQFFEFSISSGSLVSIHSSSAPGLSPIRALTDVGTHASGDSGVPALPAARTSAGASGGAPLAPTGGGHTSRYAPVPATLSGALEAPLAAVGGPPDNPVGSGVSSPVSAFLSDTLAMKAIEKLIIDTVSAAIAAHLPGPAPRMSAGGPPPNGNYFSAPHPSSFPAASSPLSSTRYFSPSRSSVGSLGSLRSYGDDDDDDDASDVDESPPGSAHPGDASSMSNASQSDSSHSVPLYNIVGHNGPHHLEWCFEQLRAHYRPDPEASTAANPFARFRVPVLNDTLWYLQKGCQPQCHINGNMGFVSNSTGVGVYTAVVGGSMAYDVPSRPFPMRYSDIQPFVLSAISHSGARGGPVVWHSAARVMLEFVLNRRKGLTLSVYNEVLLVQFFRNAWNYMLLFGFYAPLGVLPSSIFDPLVSVSEFGLLTLWKHTCMDYDDYRDGRCRSVEELILFWGMLSPVCPVHKTFPYVQTLEGSSTCPTCLEKHNKLVRSTNPTPSNKACLTTEGNAMYLKYVRTPEGVAWVATLNTNKKSHQVAWSLTPQGRLYKPTSTAPSAIFASVLDVWEYLFTHQKEGYKPSA